MSMARSVAGLAVVLAVATPALAQKAPADNPELAQLYEADQAERKGAATFTQDQWESLTKRDRERIEQVRTMLAQGKVRTGSDFDHAGVIFQHGETPGDYLTAHELVLVQLTKSDGSANNLIAASEDRFLTSIGRRQRFGTQGSYGPNGTLVARLVQEDGEAVTDGLRADLYVAPLAEFKKNGVILPSSVFEPLMARLKQRRDRKWQTEQRKRPEVAELAKLAEAPDADAAARVLELYRSDALRVPEEYANAALVLLRSAPIEKASDLRADRYMLAHELATVAAVRGDRDSASVALEALDWFLVTIGMPPRYGKAKPGQANLGPGTVSESVKAALGL